MKKLLLLGSFLMAGFTSYSQLVLNNAATAAQLVSNLVGSGITVSNIQFTGSLNSKATFTCSGACPLGFPSGIMLSTGNASGITSPASHFASTGMGTAGDAVLNGIVAPQTTFDAVVLEFDFTAPSDSIQFEYIFSSEEYNEYVNTNFNDVFAFHISGPGIVGNQNIALVPNTVTPVSINNVNNGNSFGAAGGPCTNCTYYQDNFGGANFFMDGYTVGLVAKAKVQPCQTYHMRLAIADVGDGVFDSGVFLKENSFTAIGTVSVTANTQVMPNNGIYYACSGTSVQLCLTQNPTYNWSNGATTQCITVTEQNIVPGGQYQAIFFGANGCVATSMVQVVFQQPTATITPSGPVDLCPGGSVTLNANPGQSYLWSNGAISQSITVSAAGTYTVTVSNGPSCSATSTPVTVTVGSAAANISGILSLCNGASTTLTANAGQSYAWSTGASSQSISVSSSGTYTVTVTQAGGCTATANVNVQVNPAPSPSITGILSICQGATTTLDAGAGFATYAWSNGAISQTISPSASGTYTVTVTNAGGCSASTSVVLNVSPLPSPVIAGNLTFCSGNSSTLDAGAGYASYAWNTGAATQTLSVNASGTYTVTVTNAGGCTATSNVAVTVNPLPAPAITGTIDFCQGSNTSLNATAGFAGYQWNTGASTAAINVNTANTFTVTVTDANGCTGTTSQTTVINPNPVPSITGTNSICQGANTSFNAGAGYSSYSWSTGATSASVSLNTAGTYTVTVTDANGCTGTTSAVLTVNPLPAPNITGTLSFCSGNSSTLNAGAGFSSYAWNTGAATQTLSVNTSGTYTVTVTNANGCTATTNAVVTVNPLPAPAINGTLDFCQGTNTSLNATAGFANYQWNTGASTAAINVNTANTFTVTVTDANGCTGTTSQTTVVNPNPVPSITGTNTICQGANTSFNAGAGYSAYAWSTGATSASVSLNTSGTYTVTVTDANGCSGTTSATLTVNPNPTPAITGTLSFCSGNSSTLNAGAGFSSYAWNTGAATQTLSVNTSGTYTVTVTNANGCTATTNAVVTVNPLPAPAINGTLDFCQGTNTSLNATAGFANYQWNTGASTAAINVNTANTFTVTVTDANGCTGTTSQTTVVNPNPVPSITGTNTICQGANTSFNAGAGYSAYAWSTGATSASVSLNTSGTYTVTVTDANGCSGTTSATLTVNPNPTPAITGTLSFCSGNSSTLNAGAGFSSYAWNTGAATQTLSVNTSGTYTVTVTNANGCTATTNAVVTVNPLPNPSITGPTAICIGNNATLNAGAGFASYLWSNGETTQTITTAAAGTYSVTVTSAAGCTGSTSSSLLINPLPTPAIAGTMTICQGDVTTLDAGSGYSSYLWSNGSTSQTINTGNAGAVTVTVTDANGCSSPTSASVTVNPLPVPAITGLNAFCDGLNSTLDAGSGFASYLWNTGATSRTIVVSTAGSYTVTVTANTGCIGSDNENVTVYANPVPVINGGTGICQGSNTVLTVPGSYASYQWNTGETTSSITVSSAGSYSVTVTSGFGCSGTTNTQMVINPLPTPAITGITAVCQGNTTTFDAGAGYTTYQWSNGATGQTISPGTAGSYTVTVTDNNGCQNNTDISLVVNPLPTPSITGDFEFCQGDNSDLNAGLGYVSYLWSDGTTGSVINVTTAGSYSVTVTDNNGCSASASTAIIVNALPVPVITGDNTICDGTTTVFNAGNYASYVWSDGSVTSSITIGTAGNYAVTVTDINGCVGSTSEALTVYDLPTASITGNNTICFGESTDLTVSFTGAAPFTYTFSNGSVVSPGITAPALTATLPVSPNNTTTYTLITVSDANCQGNVAGSAAVTVNQLPLPVISGDLSICDGETTALTATPGFVSYNWSNAATQPNISTGSAGIYTVTVVDQNGCSNTSPAVNLIVNMVPVVSFTNDTSLSCEVPKINFTNQSAYDPGSYFQWTFGDGGVSNAVNPSHLYAAPGTYQTSLTITTPAGCVSSNSQPVSAIFFPLPVADFIYSPGATNVFNGKVSFVDRSDFAVSWLWDFGDGNKSVEQNPSHYFNEVGDFRVSLTITNIAGCVDRYEEVISINPFYIPNAFTPNGDGVNDQFYYSGYDLDISSYRMRIFNRWGQLVFAGQDENDSWSGEGLGGQPAPAGTYVYKLQVTTRGGKEHVFHGQVNLVR